MINMFFLGIIVVNGVVKVFVVFIGSRIVIGVIYFSIFKDDEEEEKILLKCKFDDFGD